MEMTITANHLGHYLLTLLLVPLMHQSAVAANVRGRIVNLTSALHHVRDLDSIVLVPASC
jgi:NAD(P)-dependent dehydrogenase (short-subunit alcohol dehydrogenase family)